MQTCYAVSGSSVPIFVLTQESFVDWFTEQSSFVKFWVQNNRFNASPSSLLLVPGEDGQLSQVVVGVKDLNDAWAYADLSTRLPEGCYRFASLLESKTLELASLAWGLHAYRFERYKPSKTTVAQLILAPDLPQQRIINQLSAITLVRDLINTPTEDLGPEQLANTAKELSKTYDAHFREIVGERLLDENFPAIHAVGRASQRPPRFIQLTWGDKKQAHIVLVGKGVCFDSGGLDLKSASNMRLMKKDMGGAAHVLGLAQLIMSEQLPIHLTVLIPAVENVIDGNAYRPGDVIASRKGLTIEIGNTDAEGRVILSDALHYATELSPTLIIDFATLTGAARIAMGTDLPAMFCNQDEIAETLIKCANQERDPLWRLPLYAPYRKLLDSSIAHICNESASSYGGALTAALFLQEFIENKIPWIHFDLMAWNLTTKPGRPEGGEAMALRAVFQYLAETFVE